MDNDGDRRAPTLHAIECHSDTQVSYQRLRRPSWREIRGTRPGCGEEFSASVLQGGCAPPWGRKMRCPAVPLVSGHVNNVIAVPNPEHVAARGHQRQLLVTTVTELSLIHISE